MNKQENRVKNTRILDEWFGHYLNLVREVVVPYQWQALNDEVPGTEPSHSIRNFKMAGNKLAGETVTEPFQGFVFQDSDLYKWLEAVAYLLASEWDENLFNQAEYAISLIGKAQEEDGYINTYFSLENPDKRWKNLCDCHELYCAGHMFEAAVAYTKATNTSDFLAIACRFADLLVETFGPEANQIHGYPGHEEIELALVRLWELTEKEAYLNLAKYFINERGQAPNYLEEERARDDFFAFYPGSKAHKVILEYHQAHKPVLEQESAEGHAVRATYLYQAMADLAYYTDDEKLKMQCEQLWNNIVKTQMYVTGGIGQSALFERFSTSYDLPNQHNYSETCASIGLANFSRRMGDIFHDGKYDDIIELELYNGIASGISLDGQKFFYVNPMEVWPKAAIPHTSKEHIKPERQGWFPCACCPPNLARTYADLASYIWSYDSPENTLFIRQYIASEIVSEAAGVELKMHGEYAKDAQMRLNLSCSKELRLALRKPQWAASYTLSLNGTAVDAEEQLGYLYLTIPEGKASLELGFEMLIDLVLTNPQVRDNRGLVSVRRGPIIYCAEEVDNGENLASLLLDPQGDKKYISDDAMPYILVDGVLEKYSDWPDETLYQSLEAVSQEVVEKSLKLVPYALWGNRAVSEEKSAGEMRVWLRLLQK